MECCSALLADYCPNYVEIDEDVLDYVAQWYWVGVAGTHAVIYQIWRKYGITWF